MLFIILTKNAIIYLVNILEDKEKSSVDSDRFETYN